VQADLGRLIFDNAVIERSKIPQGANSCVRVQSKVVVLPGFEHAPEIISAQTKSPTFGPASRNPALLNISPGYIARELTGIESSPSTP
jgi:hypothetical protein